jgi:hypothetical protein
MRRQGAHSRIALKWFLTALTASGRLHFLDPACVLMTFKAVPSALPLPPFDKEFAGSPVMPHIPTGMAGLFVLEIGAEPFRIRKGRSLCLVAASADDGAPRSDG